MPPNSGKFGAAEMFGLMIKYTLWSIICFVDLTLCDIPLFLICIIFAHKKTWLVLMEIELRTKRLRIS